MQYDRYELKIEKIEKFFKMVFKHMAKIIAVLAVIMVTTVTLLATRGIITVSDEPFSNEIIYGDRIFYKAKAFLSKVDYEYSPAGSDDWDSNHPDAPGEYQVRAVAKATFGYRYSDAETFTIQKKPITVTILSDTVQYGDTPLVISDLAYDDTITDYTLSYNHDRTEVSIESVVISDVNGNDITSKYDIRTESKSITTVSRPLTIDIKDVTKVYDGTPLVSNEYGFSEGSLADGDRIDISFSASITDAGTERNVAVYKILNSVGEDVTRFYDIKEDIGYLTVDACPVSVTTADDQKTYDGTPLYNEGCTVDGLIEGHTYSVSNRTELTNADRTQNILTVCITDEIGNDVTKNYKLSYTYGTLNVDKRPIHITTGTDSKLYDGEELFNESYDISDIPEDPNDGLAIGHTITVSSHTSVIVAGEEANKLEFLITDALGNPVTDNYDFSYTHGKLTVTARTLKFRSEDQSWTYDGIAHSFQELTYIEAESDGVAPAHKYIITWNASIENVGTCKNLFTVTVVNKNDETVDLTHNYIIDCVFGDLTVNARPISITTGSEDIIYNGESHSNTSYTDTSVGVNTGILESLGHYIEVTESTTVTDVSRDGDGNVIGIKNIFTKFTVYDDNGNDVTANYDPSWTHGMLKVIPRPITVSTGSASKIYDGTPLTSSELIVVNDGLTSLGLANGHTLFSAEAPYGSQTDAGWSYNSYIGTIYIYSAETDVTGNYEIAEVVFGTLHVDKRPITVVTESYTGTYDGEEHKFINLTLDPENGYPDLGVGHTFSVTFAPAFKNVMFDGDGNVISDANTVTFQIMCESTPIDHNNYDITVVYGTVRINLRPIELTTDSDTWIYNDTPRFNIGYTDTSVGENTGLITWLSHRIDVTKSTAVTDVMYDGLTVIGTDNVFSEYEIYDANGDKVTENYQISFVYGTLTIVPRPIKIQTDGYREIYDGKEHSFSTPTPIIEENVYYPLCDGHFFDNINAPTFKDVMFDGEGNVISAKNEVTFIIVRGGTDVTKNYAISYAYGDIQIDPRPIKVSTQGDTWIYDGKEHSFSTPTPIIEENVFYPLCDGHFFDNINAPTFKDVMFDEEGNVTYAKNAVTFIIVCGKEDVTKNYRIEYDYGKVQINPRPIKVSTQGDTWIYDGESHSFSTPTPIIEENVFYPLCDGHFFDNINAPTFKDVMFDEEGNVTYAKNAVTFIIVCGKEDVTKNYRIEYDYGKVQINPRPIKVSTQGDIWIYDGKSHSFSTPTPIIEENVFYPLCDGHFFYNIDAPTFKDVMFDEEGNVTYAKNAVTFIIVCGEEDVTKNYRIEYDYGKVQINPRPIKVSTQGDTWIYDGESHSFSTPTPIIEENVFYPLCDGHFFDNINAPTFKDVMFDGEGNVISAKNEVTFIIVCDGADVTKNYAISYVYGDIQIDLRPLDIKTGSESWVYDGKAHSCPDYILLNETSFAEGHYLRTKNASSVTTVADGIITNSYEVIIYDESSYEVTKNYAIRILEKGTVQITPRKIFVGSASASKVYDGTPLTKHVLEILESSPNRLPNAHTLSAEFSGTITEVKYDADGNVIGVDNVFDINTVKVYNKDSEDVTENFEIDTSVDNYAYGTLTVYPPEEDPEDPEDPTPPINDPGKIQRPDPSAPEVKVLAITSDTSGKLYLKTLSLGNYNGKRWLTATEYEKLIGDHSSMQYLTAYALKTFGAPTSNVKIVSHNGEYVLPYYALDENCEIQLSDVYVDGATGEEYHLLYFAWKYQNGVSVPDGLAEYEADYAEFVRANYLDIDDDTRAVMQTIIDKYKLSKDDPEIINKVASCIQGAAKYSMDYPAALDQSSNIVVDFLTVYKEGICQHFASAATLLFRALDIPARYTVGYVIDVEADTETEVTSKTGHAWVEVYVEGLGWVQVEVTAGFGGGGDGKDPDTDEPPTPEDPVLETLEIQPYYMQKVFDNQPLTYDQTKGLNGNDLFLNLLKLGYTYEFTVSGSQTSVGSSESAITSFTLYDPYKNNVTDQYEIVKKTNTLKVTKTTVKIYLPKKDYEYTAMAYSYTVDECITVEIEDGMTFNLTWINVSLTNVDKITSADINKDPSAYLGFKILSGGSDVTDNFDIEVVDFETGDDYDVITVRQRHLEIKTGDATKTDDGTPCENKTFYVSKGFLAEGHRIVLKVTGSLTHKGTDENYASYGDLKIYDENGNEVTSNYTWTGVNGTLTIL